MAEVLEYLKGIRQEDIDKIPKKLITFLKENSSDSYECKFDYNKPMREQELLNETKGIISMICLNYWCETTEQKENFIKKLNENEIKYQEQLRKKYNPDSLFKKKELDKSEEQTISTLAIVEYKKDKLFTKIINIIKKAYKKYIK